MKDRNNVSENSSGKMKFCEHCLGTGVIVYTHGEPNIGTYYYPCTYCAGIDFTNFDLCDWYAYYQFLNDRFFNGLNNPYENDYYYQWYHDYKQKMAALWRERGFIQPGETLEDAAKPLTVYFNLTLQPSFATEDDPVADAETVVGATAGALNFRVEPFTSGILGIEFRGKNDWVLSNGECPVCNAKKMLYGQGYTCESVVCPVCGYNENYTRD
jgi:hypothetical protein